MKKADWILVGVVLGFTVILAVIGVSQKESSLGQDNLVVVVEQDGKVIEHLPLYEDITIRIPVNDGCSVLRIQDGLCYMESAPCPDQICVHHKAIGAVEESIVCLPYKIIVWIEEDTGNNLRN